MHCSTEAQCVVVELSLSAGARVLFELGGCLYSKAPHRDVYGWGSQLSILSLLRDIFISSRLAINHSVGFYTGEES